MAVYWFFSLTLFFQYSNIILEKELFIVGTLQNKGIISHHFVL